MYAASTEIELSLAKLLATQNEKAIDVNNILTAHPFVFVFCFYSIKKLLKRVFDTLPFLLYFVKSRRKIQQKKPVFIMSSVKRKIGKSLLPITLSFLGVHCALAVDFEEIKILAVADKVLAEPVFGDSRHFGANIKIDNTSTKKQERCGDSEFTVNEVKKIAVTAAQKYNVPTELVLKVIETESNYDQSRNSPKGARGAMQLMPSTATAYGVNDRCDTVQNIEAGTKFLSKLLEKYGSTDLALAAYNAGETQVDRAGGIPPIPETQNYVKKISGAISVKEPATNEKVAGIVIGLSTTRFANGVINFNFGEKNDGTK